MDAKAHRKTSHLEIKALYFDSNGFKNNDFDEDLVIKAFVEAITQFAHFQNSVSVSLTKAQPKHLRRLRRALEHLS